MIYVHKDKGFPKTWDKLAKIQIDNSLELGWKKEDMIFCTNFPFKHNGIKALEVPDECFCEARPSSTKSRTISYLIKQGIIGDDLYWVRDLDGYQINPITEEELEMDGFDMALCDYGRKATWAMGSVFFKKSAGDIFNKITEMVGSVAEREEAALQKLVRNPEISRRVKKLNITYNLHHHNIDSNYLGAIKPVRNIHFFPYMLYKGKTLLRFYMGDNKISAVLMTPRLINIFKKYGI